MSRKEDIVARKLELRDEIAAVENNEEAAEKLEELNKEVDALNEEEQEIKEHEEGEKIAEELEQKKFIGLCMSFRCRTKQQPVLRRDRQQPLIPLSE